MKFKIMNYNILHGFHTITWPFTLEEQRLKLAKKIIASEKPDILVLTEACFGGQNHTNIFVDYQKTFGFPHGYFSAYGNNDEWGCFILSKHPLIKHETLPMGDRTILRSEIKLKKILIHIDVIHPNPIMSERNKVKTLKPHLATKEHPYILTGDFNSGSDEDAYDTKKLIKGFKSFVPAPLLLRGIAARFMVCRFLQRKLIPFIRSHSLRDAFPLAQRTFTIPTDLLNKEKFSAMRIDYFFVSPDIIVKDAHVIKNKDTNFASDHYPIVGVFEIK